MDVVSAARETTSWLLSTGARSLHHSGGAQTWGTVMSRGRHYPLPQGCSPETRALGTSQGEDDQDRAFLPCPARASKLREAPRQTAGLIAGEATSQMLHQTC